MIYFLYKSINTINGRYYIGVHGTNDMAFGTPEFKDEYAGSGKLLLRALGKYGRKSFNVEVLSYHETEENAYGAERELVTEEWLELNKGVVYNMIPGGRRPLKRTGITWSKKQSEKYHNTIKLKIENGYSYSEQGKRAALSAILHGINHKEQGKRAHQRAIENGHNFSDISKQTIARLRAEEHNFSEQGKQAHKTALLRGFDFSEAGKNAIRSAKLRGYDFSAKIRERVRSNYTPQQIAFLADLKNNLNQLYAQQNMSLREISLKMGFGMSSMARWAKKVGFIPTRKPWEYEHDHQ